MEHQLTQDEHGNSGLIAGMTGISKNMLGLLMSRIELAALELSEVRTNIVKLVLILLLGFVGAWFAIACLTVLVVYLSWEAMGWKILLLLTAAYLILTVAIFVYAQKMFREGKLSLPATMAELRNDRDALL
jgi:uncharacterized membrane protein YqjE